MSVRASGTEGTTPNHVPPQAKKIKENKEILVFDKNRLPKQVYGEHIKLYDLPGNIDNNTPMKDHINNFPKSFRENLTPEMKADIEAGMRTADFCKKYAKELSQNMGI